MACKTEFNIGKRELLDWVDGIVLEGDDRVDGKGVGWGNGRGIWGYGVITCKTLNIFITSSVKNQNMYAFCLLNKEWRILLADCTKWWIGHLWLIIRTNSLLSN